MFNLWKISRDEAYDLPLLPPEQKAPALPPEKSLFGRLCGGIGSALTPKAILKATIIPQDGKFTALEGKKILNQPGGIRHQTLDSLTNSENTAVTVELVTGDGIKLDAVWARNEYANAPTVVMFHGNGQNADDLLQRAQWFQQRGSNVLMVTIRGYIGSEGKSSEVGYYRDTEAALKFVLDQKVDPKRIHAYGVSFGGSLAIAMGYFFKLSVTSDHSFTSIGAAASYVLGANRTSDFVEGAVAKLFPFSNKPQGVSDIPGAKPFVQDSLNSLHKLSQSEKPFFLMAGERDKVVDPAFTDELYLSRYPIAKNSTVDEKQNYQQRKEAYVAIVPGGHNICSLAKPVNGADISRLSDYDQYRYVNQFGYRNLEEYNQRCGELFAKYEENSEKYQKYLVENNLLDKAGALSDYKLIDEISRNNYVAQSKEQVENRLKAALEHTEPGSCTWVLHQSTYNHKHVSISWIVKQSEGAQKNEPQSISYDLKTQKIYSLDSFYEEVRKKISSHQAAAGMPVDFSEDTKSQTLLEVEESVRAAQEKARALEAQEKAKALEAQEKARAQEVQAKANLVKGKLQELNLYISANQQTTEQLLDKARAEKSVKTCLFITRPSSQGEQFLTLSWINNYPNNQGTIKPQHMRINIDDLENEPNLNEKIVALINQISKQSHSYMYSPETEYQVLPHLAIN